jgi:hypothetical protein
MKLLSLGLDRTPASDVIEVTVGTWYEAITTGRKWDQDRDTSRIRSAFVSLAQTTERWPQPRHFLDALPRVEQVALAYEAKPLSPEQAKERLAEIGRLLKEPLPEFKATPKPEREGPPISEVEAGLRQHYASTGKMAAAGKDA